MKDALKRAGIFPQIIYEMVGTGEETGKLDVVMEKVADFTKKRYSPTRKSSSVWLNL